MTFGSDPAVVYECRMGLAALFYRLSHLALQETNDRQMSHDMNQLAMAMVWDVSRSHMDCLSREKIWGHYWLSDFMNEYLTLALELKRNEDETIDSGLYPYWSQTVSGDSPVNPSRIAIATVCDYQDPSHVLFGIDKISLDNRIQYTKKHGYSLVFETDSKPIIAQYSSVLTSPVWSAIALGLKLLESGNFSYVMWMDCDALFINMDEKIESIISRFPDKSLFISEDGRGLSGGNWIVRNTDWSKSLLKSLLTNPGFNLFDLKDQFGLLWSLLGPPSWASMGENRGFFNYPHQVALVPQRLINAYPYALCRPSHHCFQDNKDFIVSFITLGSQSREMAMSLLNNFASRTNGTN